MAHIVYVTNGMASTVNCALELTRRIANAGHRVTFVSPADLRAVMAANDRAFRQLTSDQDFAAELDALPPPWKQTGRWGLPTLIRWYRARRRLRARSATMQPLQSLLEELAPDLVIIDIELHAAVLTARSMQLPIVLVIVFFSIFRNAALPPMHTSLLPGSGPLAQWRIRLAWLTTNLERLRLEWRARLSRSGIAHLLEPIRANTFNIDDLRAVASARRVRLRAEADRTQWLRPLVYTRLPILTFNIRELEFPHTPAANLHYVGPMVARTRTEIHADAASLQQWAEWKARRRAQSQRPLIYCSLGSYWSADERLLRKVMAAFAREPTWDLVVGLGSRLSPEALHPVPPNVLLLRWAPQLDVLAEADCCLTHGGNTTLNECATLGVPMVMYSTCHIDQNGNAARVHWHRLGVRADKDADGPDEIRNNIRHVLTDPEIQRRVQTIRDRLREVERDDLALQAVERALAGRLS